MNLLQLLQEFCARKGLPKPQAVAGSRDLQISQMQGLMNKLCDDLITRKAFEKNTIEKTFLGTGVELQGLLVDLFPEGYQGIVLETFFNRTQRIPVRGGVTPSEWQDMKASNITGPYSMFRIQRGQLLFYPAPSTAHTFALEYKSGWFVMDNTGPVPVYKRLWTADSDTFVFDDALPLAWLDYAWSKEKGLEYAEAFVAYELQIHHLLSLDNAPRSYYLGNKQPSIGPGIRVPDGNWMVP